jgi:hypothetical protein
MIFLAFYFMQRSINCLPTILFSPPEKILKEKTQTNCIMTSSYLLHSQWFPGKLPSSFVFFKDVLDLIDHGNALPTC